MGQPYRRTDFLGEHLGPASLVQSDASCSPGLRTLTVTTIPRTLIRSGHEAMGGAAMVSGFLILGTFQCRCSRRNDQHTKISFRSMIPGHRSSYGRMISTFRQPRILRNHILYSPGLLRRVCASSPASSTEVIQFGPVPRTLKLRQCDEDNFSRFDSDGSTIMDGYVEDGFWEQNTVRRPHMITRGNQFPNFLSSQQETRRGSKDMRQLRQIGWRLTFGADAHQHLKLEPWTATWNAQSNREAYCEKVAHHCILSVDPIPSARIHHTAIPCDLLHWVCGPF